MRLSTIMQDRPTYNRQLLGTSLNPEPKCPPQAGPLAKATSIILVEYPKRLAHQIPDTLCGLPKVPKQDLKRFLQVFGSVV